MGILKKFEAAAGWSISARMIRCSDGGGPVTDRRKEHKRMNLEGWMCISAQEKDKNNSCLYFMSVNTKLLLCVIELLIYFIYLIINQVSKCRSKVTYEVY